MLFCDEIKIGESGSEAAGVTEFVGRAVVILEVLDSVAVVILEVLDSVAVCEVLDSVAVCEEDSSMASEIMIMCLEPGVL